MSILQIQLPAMRINDIAVPGPHVVVPVYHVLTTTKGRMYFDRWSDGHQGESWTKLPGEWSVPHDALIVTLDPITAIMRGLVTAEEAGLPCGLDGLFALMKPV
jgi:hypothetical protein